MDGHGYVLYAHVPFCERLCTYCSFNRFLYKEDWAREYFRHLRAEMHLVAGLGYDFASLYIGGGTPTILLDELAETIDLAKALFPGILEVSAETSPNHLSDEMVEILDGRVQRLSCGVQSFDDRLLRQMDRYGKYGTGEEVFERLKNYDNNSRSSLYHDLANNRRLEIDALSGAVVRLGRRHGIATPVHEVIVGALLPYHRHALGALSARPQS